MADTFTLRILRFLPKNLISRAFGAFAGLERPRWFVRRFVRWFAGRFKIDLAEAARPIDEYPSLLKFFTRELKPGVRPVDARPDVLVSPVDAAVGAFGRIEAGRLYQAKGMDYSLAALVGDEAAARMKDGWFLTLYLSPRDYHRIHSPADGAIGLSLYHDGTLWPVNPPAVRTIPSLFAVNERLTPIVETGRTAIAVCMVGATNVGSIRLAFADFCTNRGEGGRTMRHAPPVAVRRGEHIGTFELGSTVVLVVGDPNFEWQNIADGMSVRMGQAIGRFR